MKYKIYQFSFGDGYAGSAKMAILSSSVLSESGNDVTLIVSKNSLTERRAKEKNIKTIEFDSTQKYSQLFDQILSDVKINKPDFCITYHSLDRKIGNSLKSKLGKKIINVAYRQNMSKSIPIIGSLIYNFYCDMTLACSKGVAADLIQSGLKKNIVKVIHNVTEYPENIYSIDGTKIRNQYCINNKFVIGVSSWFHKERKGFDILFKAFSKLEQEFVLLIIGIPTEMQQEVIDYAATFGISSDRVILPGFVDNIYEYYKAMDVFVLPSRSEGFSLALLEAAAAGIPIIASNIPGNDEFIIHKQNGLLFDIKNPDELVESIKIFDDTKTLAQELGEKASKDALENYNLKKYGLRLTELLNEAYKAAN
jgi:glycosyltransferase involved in cell wall biosynthesis